MTGADHLPPRRFRIRVDGRLSDGFARGFDGVEQEDAGPGTILSGAFVDDAHLQGVLDHLRGMGIGIQAFEVDLPRVPASAKGAS